MKGDPENAGRQRSKQLQITFPFRDLPLETVPPQQQAPATSSDGSCSYISDSTASWEDPGGVPIPPTRARAPLTWLKTTSPPPLASMGFLTL